MPTAAERIQEIVQPPIGDRSQVALDTNCIEYYVGAPPSEPWATCLDPVFQAAVAGHIDLYASTVVLAEMASHLYFHNRNNGGYDPQQDLNAILYRHFQILDVTDAVAKQAADLRGNYAPSDKIKLETADALIGGTSLEHDHTVFITNDAELANALPQNKCIYLRDVALEWLGQHFPNPCFDGSSPITPAKLGKGLPVQSTIASLEIGSVKPDPAAKWRRILKDAQTVAAGINEPCIFFILSEMNGRRIETLEVLFWHEGLAESRPPGKLIKRLHQHLGYSRRTATASHATREIHGIFFTSLAHEKTIQSQPQFASKNDHQKESGAWSRYLAIWFTFKDILNLPQSTLLLCEDGIVHQLDTVVTLEFLDKAKNVLGWKD